jgi:SET domain-containing protein|tara:strand:- start:38 stop:496 length:459 start_codon:yes stop_codon:yes gene_type:complete
MQANKYKLLKNLKETYCSFGISKIHGIGVFAIRDIPKGINPLPIIKPEKTIKLTDTDLESLPKEIAKKIKDIFVRHNGIYHVYDLGLNCMGIKFHVNHSDNPNIAVNEGVVTSGYNPFITLRDIQKGEELFWNYTISNGDNILNQFKFIKNE